MIYRVLVPVIIIAALLISGCCCCINVPAQWGNMASSGGYSNVKQHVFMGSTDSALPDYQVKLIVHSGYGTDNGQNVYLNGNSQSWPNDIRFMNNDGTPLDFWIESYDPDTATMWVKIDNIPASHGQAFIKLYYGRRGDPGASNGAATFQFFDDFSSGYIDTNRWNITGSPTIYYDDGKAAIRISQGNSINSKNLWVDKCHVIFSMKYLSFSDWHYSGISGPRLDARFKDDGTKGYSFKLETNADGSKDNDLWAGTGLTKYPNPLHTKDADVHLARVDRRWNTNTWYTVNIQGSDDRLRADVDGTVLEATEVNNYTGGIGFGTWDTGSDVLITNIAVGKYTPNEPIHGSWSS